MQPLEPVAGRCAMAWSVFKRLPPVRAAAPTENDLQALRNHLQRSGLLSRDGMVTVGADASPLEGWLRSISAGGIPPRLTAAKPRRRRRSGSNFPGTGQSYRPWNPLTGSYYQ